MIDGGRERGGRRAVLTACGVAAAGFLGGCTGLIGGSGTTDAPETETETESPDDGFGPESQVYGFDDGAAGRFVDRSQSASEPMITDEPARDGGRALALESEPGTNSRCLVATEDSFHEPTEYAATLNRYGSTGPENAVGIRLQDVDSDARLSLFHSGYFGGVSVSERDTSGEQTRTRVARSPTDDEWHEFGLVIRDGTTVASSVDDESTTITTDGDWASRTVRLELFANAWGNGHAVSAAFDSVTVAWPASA